MVDIYGRSLIRKTEKVTDKDFDASKYATKDDLADLMNLAGVDRDEVVVFQDKHGVLKTSTIKWIDVVRRVLGAVMYNIPVFTESGKIRDSGISIEYIRNKILKNIQKRFLDAATKRYVDTVDGKLSTLKTEHNTVDENLSTLRAEYDVHVGGFVNIRRNFRKLDEIAEQVFGKPIIAETKLSDIKTSIDTFRETQDDIVGDTRNIINKIDLLEKYQGKILRKRINNVVYTISSGLTTWSQQNNSIKHTAQVTGVFRLSVFGAEKFEIFTTYPWRHSTDRFSGTVSVILNSGDEEIFILVAFDETLTAATIRWCLEFVAETPRLTKYLSKVAEIEN
ncbi:hypothetical protein ACJMK2_012735 [Sinanodonta woodiana]|uniref:Uncharacterized protein n=1 Tax=Sinanodonta woodiana TaxID=1069815 RepID=A0ABD3V964_SINWO